MTDLRIATLNDARSRRSAEKRAAVEDAIMQLRETRQAVTFVSVAREAKVSRQYLYNNFADEIGEERVETRAETEVIDGKKVPLRTPEEYRHIEAALRNKIERLETELRDARAEKAKADRTAERERGKAQDAHGPAPAEAIDERLEAERDEQRPNARARHRDARGLRWLASRSYPTRVWSVSTCVIQYRSKCCLRYEGDAPSLCGLGTSRI